MFICCQTRYRVVSQSIQSMRGGHEMASLEKHVRYIKIIVAQRQAGCYQSRPQPCASTLLSSLSSLHAYRYCMYVCKYVCMYVPSQPSHAGEL